jgi:hypothetical protein
VRSGLVLLCACLALAACGPRFGPPVVAETIEPIPAVVPDLEPDPEPEPEPEPEPDPEPAGPRAPLTAVRVDDPAMPGRPILAVKIENSARSRPQTGLEVADVVVEYLVEGGLTRFTALFHSRVPGEVGPVRSARPEDAEFLPAFRPLLALSGARGEVLEALRAAQLATLPHGSAPGYYRQSGRRAPHNLFARPAELFRAGQGRAPAAAAPGWRFTPDPPPGGDGGRLTVIMSRAANATWTYDPDAGVYRRQQHGTAHTVTGDGRIGPANVLVLRTSVGDGGCCDTSGARYVRTATVGEGPVRLLRDGVAVEGRWRKQGPSAPLELAAADGGPLPLKPGQTWIMLAPR